MGKPYTRLVNYFLDGNNPPVKVSRRQAIGIFDREDNLIRIGTYADYEAYWGDGINELPTLEYIARQKLPEVPYSFWIYEPIVEPAS